LEFPLSKSEWLRSAGLREYLPDGDRGRPRRQILLAPSACDEMTEMGHWPRDRDKDKSPGAQIRDLFDRFIEGRKSLSSRWDYKIEPKPKERRKRFVYYLRTRDVRAFGFLSQKGEFVVVRIMLKKDAKKKGDEEVFNKRIGDVVQFVEQLPVPRPKVYDGEIYDVL
jgi:hypothetical protein